MDLSGIIHESAAYKIDIGSKAGNEAFIAGLHRWSSNPAEISHKAAKQRSFATTLNNNLSLSEKITEFFDKYSAAEKDNVFDQILAPPTAETTESKSQLVFTSPNLTPLNYAPFLLTILYLVKVFITPAFAVLLPITLIIVPFLTMKYIYKMSIDFQEYWLILQGLLFKQTSTSFEKLQRLGHLGWVSVSIGQTMIQPVITAKHIYNLNSIYHGYYTRLIDLYSDWQSLIVDIRGHGWEFSDKSYKIWFDTYCGDTRMFLAGLQEPGALKCWIRAVGDLHVMHYFSKTATPIHTINCGQPFINLIGAYDPQISEDKRKLINFSTAKSQHYLLTGPNRGGKSTVLRSVLINVLLAQAYGVCLAQKMTISPVKWIHTCLRLEDIPGTHSLFEREVFMAARSLSRLRADSQGLILIDELFHSTNPSDSNRASKIYTQHIWNSLEAISVISTHDFNLVEMAPANIGRLCCPATERQDGAIEYSYCLKEGICTISSVNEILVEKGVGLA